MQAKQILAKIINSDDSLPINHILELVLPPKHSDYSIQEIEDTLRSVYNEVEQVQRDHNDKFDLILDEPVQEKLKNLCQDLHKTQLDVMKLQCDIAFAKEQHDIVTTVCNSKVIQERRELLEKEQNLKKSLQQMKFHPVRDFFHKFVNHLDTSIATCRKLLAYQASNYQQTFDWGHYHQTMFLLRACGKTVIDIDRLERLYQSGIDLVSVAFKQPTDKMDLNNFIELRATYSLESQMDVLLDEHNQRCDFGQFIMAQNVRAILDSREEINFELFRSDLEKLKSITIDCCRLIIDLNLNYIEAHFTDGINIDKLNGSSNTPTTLPSTDEQTLPSYAFSPQEYITQIGQHLLTLRKQTEQFDQINNEPLKLALESLEQAQNIPLDVKSCKTITEIVLRCIARHCIRSLIARTTNSILSKLTTNGRTQLATDVMYLDNVLEDLGLLGPSEPNVEKFKSLFTQ